MSRERRDQGDPTTETQVAQRAERVAGWLRVPLIAAALLAVPTIIVQESDLGGFWQTLAVVLDWCIWAMFAANLAIMLSIVPDRRRWLIENPLDVLIVVLTLIPRPGEYQRQEDASQLPTALLVVDSRLRGNDRRRSGNWQG